MIDIRQLHHFVAVTRHGSFKGAADALAISQSSMTKSIAKLEQTLSLRLFNRTTRTVEATDSGRTLLKRADAVIQAVNAFEEEARMLAAGDLGKLRVGAIALVSDHLLAQALARLATHQPNLQIDLVVGSRNVYADLIAGECDLVIGDEANLRESPHVRNLRMTPLQTEKIVLMHRRDHPSADDFTALVKQPLAIPSRYYNENQIFNAFRALGGPVEPSYRLNSLSSCLALAQNSDVVTLAPATVAAGSQDLAYCETDLGVDIQLVMVSLAAYSPTPAMRAFQHAVTAAESI